MEEAINNARWCQHVHQAVYGKEKKFTRGEGESDSEEPMVYSTVHQRPAESAPQGGARATQPLRSMEMLLDDFRREMQQKLDQLTAKASNPVTASRPAPGGIPLHLAGPYPQVEVEGAAIGQASGVECMMMWNVICVGNWGILPEIVAKGKQVS